LLRNLFIIFSPKSSQKCQEQQRIAAGNPDKTKHPGETDPLDWDGLSLSPL
jgi:hypothetical protein